MVRKSTFIRMASLRGLNNSPKAYYLNFAFGRLQKKQHASLLMRAARGPDYLLPLMGQHFGQGSSSPVSGQV